MALGIFAMMSSGFLVASQKASQQVRQLEERTFALWLAQDRLAEIRQLQIPLSEAKMPIRVETASRSWSIETQVEKTAVQEMVKLHVTVALDAEEDSKISYLEGYFRAEGS